MFKPNEKVYFDNGPVKGYGYIRGIAGSELPLLGKNWIIEVAESNPPIPNDTYPYSFVAFFESQISRKHGETPHQ